MKMGLVGSNGSGKSALCAYFEEKGFQVISLSDVVRSAARERGLVPDRDTLVEIGNELKQANGEAILAYKCLEMTQNNPNIVFDSIRNVAEATALKENGVFLIGLDAPLELRYQRIVARKNETDRVDFDTFKAQDERENEGKSSGQNIFETLKCCSVIIQNTGSLAELYAQIETLISQEMGKNNV